MIVHKPTGEILARTVEWMDSPTKRARGLLKYESAPQSFVAIFKLPLMGFFPAMHTFGMRFPIDILFCDRKKIILSIFRGMSPGKLVFPWRYFFGGSRFVLEFSGAELQGVRVGDELEWKDEA
jgi:uncharacterized membrane protein (UPF0127 family)